MDCRFDSKEIPVGGLDYVTHVLFSHVVPSPCAIIVSWGPNMCHYRVVGTAHVWFSFSWLLQCAIISLYGSTMCHYCAVVVLGGPSLWYRKSHVLITYCIKASHVPLARGKRFSLAITTLWGLPIRHRAFPSTISMLYGPYFAHYHVVRPAKWHSDVFWVFLLAIFMP